MGEAAICQLQSAICKQYVSIYLPPNLQEKVGIALGTLNLLPLNAMRHPPQSGTTGWYIWGGESLSDNSDFFEPLHISHIERYCEQVLPYLCLGAGWRVLIAPGQLDVWFDEKLLYV